MILKPDIDYDWVAVAINKIVTKRINNHKVYVSTPTSHSHLQLLKYTAFTIKQFTRCKGSVSTEGGHKPTVHI